MSDSTARSRTRRIGGTAVALVLCALIAGLSAGPASARTLQKGMWGPTQVDGVSQFPLYKRLGVTVYETTLSWVAAAPTRPADPKNPADPAYQWPADLDAVIAEARSNGMSVMLMLNGTPSWANGGQTPDYAPANPRDYAAFARAASRRYPAVKRWMVWGEPSRVNNWKPMQVQPLGAKITPAQAQTPRRYARLLDAAYGQLKAQSRSNLVIGGSTYTTGDIRPVDWVHNMRLPNGRPARLDLYAHNPFSFRAPNLANPASTLGFIDFSDLGRFDKQIQRELGKPRHKRIPLFLSEFTVPTGPDSEFNFYVTEKLQADWITKAFRVARKVNADTLGWIHVQDDPPIADTPTSFGGLLRYDSSPKPGFYAFMRGGR